MDKVRARIPHERLELVKKHAEKHQKKKGENLIKPPDMPFAYYRVPLTPAPVHLRYFKASDVQSPSGSKLIRVAFIGQSNSGKSTLINRIMDKKVLMASSLPRTTRMLTTCWKNVDKTQLVMYDIPAFLEKSTETDEDYKEVRSDLEMYGWKALSESDLTVVTIPTNSFKQSTDGKYEAKGYAKMVLEKLNAINVPGMLVLTKCELIENNHKLKEMADLCVKVFPGFTLTKFVSAQDPMTWKELENDFISAAKEREWLYPEYDERFKGVCRSDIDVCADLIREKIMRAGSNGTFPYWLGFKAVISNLGWTELPGGELRLDYDVEFPREKDAEAVLNSLQGEDVARIRRTANADISRFLRKKTFLFLRIKSKQVQ